MEKVRLGQKGPLVTPFCFGTLPMGPLQANVSLEKGERLIEYALSAGINFFDTAQNYNTYQYLKGVLKKWGREKVVIASKSSKDNYLLMEEDIQKGLKDLNTDFIDIFHLHAARELEPFQKRAGALECLLDYQKRGVIGSIGIATHSVKVVHEAAEQDAIQVILALINKSGKGIIDGSAQDMVEALQYAGEKKKGIYAMKTLAGGSLIPQLQDAFHYIMGFDFIDSIAIGVVKEEEIDINMDILSGRVVHPKRLERAREVKRLRILKSLCIECGNCIEECPNEALSMGPKSAQVDYQLCITCGYCIRVCPQFCIRIT